MKMNKIEKKMLSAASDLSNYCYRHYNPDGRCRCLFWEQYPYGHCALHMPLCWPISRIKAGTEKE